MKSQESVIQALGNNLETIKNKLNEIADEFDLFA